MNTLIHTSTRHMKGGERWSGAGGGQDDSHINDNTPPPVPITHRRRTYHLDSTHILSTSWGNLPSGRRQSGGLSGSSVPADGDSGLLHDTKSKPLSPPLSMSAREEKEGVKFQVNSRFLQKADTEADPPSHPAPLILTSKANVKLAAVLQNTSNKRSPLTKKTKKKWHRKPNRSQKSKTHHSCEWLLPPTLSQKEKGIKTSPLIFR